MSKISRKKQTIDGNHAAAYVAYAYSEAAAIYPITPSSPMAELADEWMEKKQENIYGTVPVITQMQSEAGAAGAVHGALIAGTLASTFTSSQGLLLMIPNLYRIAGELLPGVFHVAARTLATHALSIFGDHSDIYACRQTGAAIFAEGSVQEVMDLSPVAHLSAIEGRIPFLNFFDGFRTSHELHKIEVWDYKDLADMVNTEALTSFRNNALHPHRAKMMGSAQNPDIFFQAREACNPFYNALPEIVEHNLEKINKKLGTSYGLFDYYGASDAEHIVIAMGSVCETIREYLEENEMVYNSSNKNQQNIPNSSYTKEKYGLVSVHLYRPFSVQHFLKTLPKTVKQITVLSRTKEPGAIGEPLYLDVLAAIQNTPFQNIPVFSGRYGLSSKDTTPAQIDAVYKNSSKKFFTVGITDDVTHLSLPIEKFVDTSPKDIISCKFWGLGGDGTISATKNAIKMIGNHTDMTVQGYFEYDSKKSRGLTISHLRFGRSSIHSTYLIHQADFVACHNPVYLHKYDMVQEIKDGGSFLLNCSYKEKELEEYLPDKVKSYLAAQHIRFYIIDAVKIGKETGLNNKISTILQAAFFRVANVLPLQEAENLMQSAAQKSYGKQGDKIIQMNYNAIHRGLNEVVEIKIPSYWAECSKNPSKKNSLDNPILPIFPDYPELTAYVKNLQQPITDQKGNEIPVSAFLPYVNGSMPSGSSAHERRNVATEVPFWKPENCIQCNRCSYVCPHAVIRPAVLTKEEASSAPKNMEMLPMMGMPDYQFAITISQTDCTSCGACVGICPGKGNQKALEMCPVHEHQETQEIFDYAKAIPPKKEAVEKFRKNTVKGSQFLRPFMEFSGACAGCGETPYVKLLTQLFGTDMYIANATGCSSIWANSTPTTAYTVNEQGHGPAWSNSLFEDAAEFGYGMLMAQEVLSQRTNHKTSSSTSLSSAVDANNPNSNNTSSASNDTNFNSASAEKENHNSSTIQWVIGGDGWAYDIGFGGLDHILASGKNINVLVLDTEVYSNTGGQASKATPLGSTAKFVPGGKRTTKKDLASMAITYGNVYVAQIAMGADMQQTVKAMTEAAAYPGPSLIIAYATCIAHGIRAGMGSSQHEEKKAVDCGYFHLFRYNPALKVQNKNPFILDSKEPNISKKPDSKEVHSKENISKEIHFKEPISSEKDAYEEFLSGEIRYDVLNRQNPDEAKELFSSAEKYAIERYQYLKKLEQLFAPDNH